MYIMNKLLKFICLGALLAGCAGTGNRWYSASEKEAVSTPAMLQYGSYSANMYGTAGQSHKIAVLLPTSGKNAIVGQSIRPAIEMAAMEFAPDGLQINFFDTGNGNPTEVIARALDTDPDIIIGPVFAENAKTIRALKPSYLPVLSFTSDISAVGDGVMSMSLMPTNTIEAIMQRMKQNGSEKFIIIAPDSQSGHIMAGIAKSLNGTYNLENTGVFFYTEGNSESLRATTMAAAMYTPRSAANTRAKEILSDILNHEELSGTERVSIANQLEHIKKRDTLGEIPYDSVLFLGNGHDTKSLASFMRYFDIGVHDAKFYGTSLWEGGDMESDITMTGSEFATLPEIPTRFSESYQNATGIAAPRMAAIGYDATMLAIDAIYSNDDISGKLLNQSGYIGTNGLFRLRPNGSNERALQIARLNGDNTVTVIKKPAETFIESMYSLNSNNITPAESMSLNTPGVNPNKYLDLPERLRKKYRSKTYGANYTPAITTPELPAVTVLPEDDSDVSVTAENYEPVKLESVSRNYIESTEIIE